jgi:hypothetical protein
MVAVPVRPNRAVIEGNADMFMYRKIAAAGATAVAIVGVGATALATSGTSATSGAGSQAAAHPAAAAAWRHHHRLLRHLVHGSVVTHGKHGYVAHSAVRGTAEAVSPTSITVKAADGYSATYTITKHTKVRERSAGKVRGKPGSMADVQTGDRVAVLGREPEKSTNDPTATVIVDGVRK